ncbi:MAG: hypothetical protein Q8R79_02990 [Legionellaceae bacterium]|nr:hypothetical protein [Legionellaceae bacterium]
MKKQNLKSSVSIKSEAESKFIKNMIHQNALATSDKMRDDEFDLEQAKNKSEIGFSALHADGGLETMLASQMLGINKLQHTCMVMANNLTHSEISQYYLNSSIKLANTFVQQATLLAKLQGGGTQKIVVERVDISHGGQAVIGSINGGSVPFEKAKI